MKAENASPNKERSLKARKKVSFTIRGKIIIGFVSVIVLMMAIFGMGFYGLNLSKQASDKVIKARQTDVLWVNWSNHIMKMISDYQSYMSTADAGLKDDATLQWNQAKAQEIALRGTVDAETKETINKLSAQADDIHSKLVDMVANSQAGLFGFSSTASTTTAVNELVDIFSQQLNEAVAKSQSKSTAELDQRDRLQYGLSLIMIMMASIAVLVAVCLTVLIPRNISRSINAISRVLGKMATGDLTASLPKQINTQGKDEISTMANSYNEMQKYLLKLVTTLKTNAAQLSNASDQLSVAAKQSSESTQQVATSAQQMARGAQEQSNSAQETAKSIEQLSGVIGQLSKGAQEQTASVQNAITSITEVSETMSEVAKNAAQAARGAKQAAESAVTGAEKSSMTLTGMDKIKSSSAEVARKIEELGTRSAEIGKIVAVIDDIAAQTNLLALNAAIEAARAGDQGRGFAVVSDEVRKLAERSAAATKEIAELIASIQKGVKEATQVTMAGSAAVTEGYKMAMEAGQSLEQILKAASEVNGQVEMISNKAQQVNSATNALVKTIDAVGSITEENSAATEQMTANAAQVSKSVETVAGIAEENSAATEEVSASAQEMSAQVQEIVSSAQSMKEMAATLEKSVAMFRIESEVKTEKSEREAVKK
jgi:methyl-accepting chemotaxis protein